MTGAGSGIGAAVAGALAAAGAAVLVTRRGRGGRCGGGRTIAAAGGQAESAALDVARPPAQAAAAARPPPSSGGVLHIVVNNAGVTAPGDVRRSDRREFQLVLDVHLMGAFTVAQAALAFLPTDGTGRIINVTSAAGHHRHDRPGELLAAKASIVGLTKSLAAEMARSNITVNAVAPLAATR